MNLFFSFWVFKDSNFLSFNLCGLPESCNNFNNVALVPCFECSLTWELKTEIWNGLDLVLLGDSCFCELNLDSLLSIFNLPSYLARLTFDSCCIDIRADSYCFYELLLTGFLLDGLHSIFCGLNMGHPSYFSIIFNICMLASSGFILSTFKQLLSSSLYSLYSLNDCCLNGRVSGTN